MNNPAPSNQVANPLGTGGANKANLTSFKPGERRVGRVKGTPNKLHMRTEKAEPEPYRTVEEVEADLRAGGYSDEKIAFLIEDLRPQNKVSAVNAEPKTPKMKTLAGANGGAGQGGDYLDTLTRTEPSGM